MAKQSLNEIEAQFRVDNDFTDVDGAYFREILHGVPQFKTEIDTALKPCLDLPSKSSTRLNWRFCACPPGNCSSASTCRTAW
jgi:transcription termination factor NusB